MPDYLQHGRRHAPGGSDPIPGSGGSPWCLIASDEGFTIDHSGGVNSINIDPTDIYTNSSSTFASFSYTGFPSGTFHGVKILVPGIYKMTLTATWTTIEAGAVGEVYYGQTSVGSGGTMSVAFLGGREAVRGSDTFNGPSGVATNGPQVFWQQLLNIPGDASSIDGFTGNNATPVELEFWAQQDSATANGILDNIQVLIEQLDTQFYKNIFAVDAE